MEYVVSSKEMKEYDKNTIEHFGVSGIVLMERAAISVCDVILPKISREANVLILCGSGNNGGMELRLAEFYIQKDMLLLLLCLEAH